MNLALTSKTTRKASYGDVNRRAAAHRPARFEIFRRMWIRNEMSLLNVSSSLLGKDGRRVVLGGEWRPSTCIGPQRVSVLVPFYKRVPYLRVLLEHLHDVMQRQLLEYTFFVVEGNFKSRGEFNKGKLVNAGLYKIFKIRSI
jgi:hypothetical protein